MSAVWHRWVCFGQVSNSCRYSMQTLPTPNTLPGQNCLSLPTCLDLVSGLLYIERKCSCSGHLLNLAHIYRSLQYGVWLDSPCTRWSSESILHFLGCSLQFISIHCYFCWFGLEILSAVSWWYKEVLSLIPSTPLHLKSKFISDLVVPLKTGCYFLFTVTHDIIILIALSSVDTLTIILIASKYLRLSIFLPMIFYFKDLK